MIKSFALKKYLIRQDVIDKLKKEFVYENILKRKH